MQIKVKKLDGQNTELNVDENDTVLKLKQTLSERSGVPKEQIKLVYLGEVMADSETLKKLRVTVGSTINMIIQLRGG